MQKSCLKYPVEFEEDVFGEKSKLAEVIGDSRVLIVADMNVVQRTQSLGIRIGSFVKANRIALAGQPVVITGGERIKTDNLQTAMRVAGAAIDWVKGCATGFLLTLAVVLVVFSVNAAFKAKKS